MLLMNKSSRRTIIPHCRQIPPQSFFFLFMFRLLLYADASSDHDTAAATSTEKSSDHLNLTSASSFLMDGTETVQVAEIFVAVIYQKSKEPVFSRIVKQTMASLSEQFTSATNLKVVAQYTALSDDPNVPNSDGILQVEEMCREWDNKPIVAVLVLAPFQLAFGHVLAALHNNIPVLWTTGQVQAGYFDRVPLSRFEIRLDAGSYEVLRSLRSLLLATHWHSFTVMHTTSVLSSQLYKTILTQPPLLPSILPFRSDSSTYYIFSLLSDISKSTKGVIILICNVKNVKRVMEESKKLNMINGDFVWLWIDTQNTLADMDVSVLESQSDKKSAEINYPPETRRTRQTSVVESDDREDVKVKRLIDNDGSRSIVEELNKPDIDSDPRPAPSNKKLKTRRSDQSRQQHQLATSPAPPQQANNRNTVGGKEKIQYGKKYPSSFLHDGVAENRSADISDGIGNRSTYNDQQQQQQQQRKENRSIRLKHTAGFSNDGDDNNDNDDSRKSGELNLKRTELFSKLLGNHRFQTANIVKRRVYPTNKYSINPLLTFMENNPSRKAILRNSSHVPSMPVGLLALQLLPAKFDKYYVKAALKLLVNSLRTVLSKYGDKKLSRILGLPRISCFDFKPVIHRSGNSLSEELSRNLKLSIRNVLASRRSNGSYVDEHEDDSLAAKFKILNLVPEGNIKETNATNDESMKWRVIGDIIGEQSVNLDTVVWPGGDIIPVSTGRGSRSLFRVVTAFAPPFVMLGELDEDGQCLRGIECHRFLTSDKDNLTLLVNEIERTEEADELDRLQLEKMKEMWGDIDIRHRHFGHKFATNCCYGLSMDLLENVAVELEFDFQLYVVADGLFGSRIITENGEVKWNGIMGDLVSGAAHMSFAPLSVSTSRAKEIDFSVPYFFSGVSFLAAPKESTDIPLLAFLLPFSPYLWIAIFTSLHMTAIAVAIYEWRSPFGLNPWGRQRSKNFGMASALWVMWGLLCGHLVQFKAPKSWPNKFLINVWGGFSVIFIASYTANIAALIAGLFFHNTVGDHHDRSLLSQRVGAPKSSAAEYYIKRTNQMLWDHMQKYSLSSIGDGVQLLKNGSLDILIADTPILDYYRATDHGCKLQKIGDTINEDTYAIGMTKGFPLKDSISAVIAKYSTNGYIDILQEKWYGGLPCFKFITDMAQPRPLGVAAVAGVFLMLGLGVVIGCLLLFSEHLFYRYTLPSLRRKPKDSIWRSRNVMFFSQKLYRFINCVELVSPHHAARELVHTLRQGQITSLFQKSVKRKEHEQRQQHRSKTQFFEMIQEIRRVQQEERKDLALDSIGKPSPRRRYYHKHKSPQLLSPTGLLYNRNKFSPGRLDFARRLSKDVFRSKSSGNLDVRRISSDINIAAGRLFDFQSAEIIGRRLSHGATESSPPDIHTRRSSQLVTKKDEDGTNLSPVESESQQSEPTGPSVSCPKSLAVTSPKSSAANSLLLKSPCSSLSPLIFSPSRISNSILSRDIGPIAARKFTNIDNSSFKGRTVKVQSRATTPKLTLNNGEIEQGRSGKLRLDTDGGIVENEECYRRPTSDRRTDSVKSTDHFIEIVIPSTSESDDKDDRWCTEDEQTGTKSFSDSECDQVEVLSPIDERCASGDLIKDGAAVSVKPKIILHMPKKHKYKFKSDSSADDHLSNRESRLNNSSENNNDSRTDPLKKLSRSDLLSLSQLPEKELKDRIRQAIKETESS